MKKVLALILALVMALSLVACGGGNNAANDDNQAADDQNTAKNYNLTKDTQIIYVDTSADNVEDICVNGGSIENASPAPEGKYYRNASFVIDSGSDLAFLIVITNTDGAYPGSIKK